MRIALITPTGPKYRFGDSSDRFPPTDRFRGTRIAFARKSRRKAENLLRE